MSACFSVVVTCRFLLEGTLVVTESTKIETGIGGTYVLY
jgi:hypothetical protein